MDNEKTLKRANFHEMVTLLRGSLGEPEKLHRASPLSRCNTSLEVLLATILTQATSDKNALQAWENFKKSFPTLDLVLAQDESVLYHAILPSGLTAQKAKTIRGVLQSVHHHFGEFSLDKLSGKAKLARDFLDYLPGIGPKTAACTLLFGLKLPAFPVDVHINRIAIRTGLVPPKTNPIKAQELLENEVPVELQADLHILLLNLGRTHCRPRNPDCPHCPIQEMCGKIQ